MFALISQRGLCLSLAVLSLLCLFVPPLLTGRRCIRLELVVSPNIPTQCSFRELCGVSPSKMLCKRRIRFGGVFVLAAHVGIGSQSVLGSWIPMKHQHQYQLFGEYLGRLIHICLANWVLTCTSR